LLSLKKPEISKDSPALILTVAELVALIFELSSNPIGGVRLSKVAVMPNLTFLSSKVLTSKLSLIGIEKEILPSCPGFKVVKAGI
jgi:hypothetical protein